MADGLKDVIAQLERQQKAIERALEALRGVEGVSAPAAAAAAPAAKAPKAAGKKKSHMSPEGRARLIAALKRRWAAKKAADAAAGGKRGAKKA